MSINDPASAIDAAKRIGVSGARFDMPWAQVEKVRGVYIVPPRIAVLVDAALKVGIQPVLILAYSNPLYANDKPRNDEERLAFGRYAQWVVKAYAGRVRYFELWNEWETKVGGGTTGSADDYVALARAVVPMIRAANPDAVLLSNGTSYPGITSGWMDRFIALDAPRLFDGIALHPYTWHKRTGWSPEEAMKLVDGVQMKLRRAKALAADHIYVTEFGYPSFRGALTTDPEVVADYLMRFMLLADARPWLKGVWWYSLRDQGRDPLDKEHGFGLFDFAMNIKPAGAAYQQANELLNGQQRRGSVESSGSDFHYLSGDSRSAADWSASDKALNFEWPRSGALRNAGRAGQVNLTRRVP
jgi:hypothetical protein